MSKGIVEAGAIMGRGDRWLTNGAFQVCCVWPLSNESIYNRTWKLVPGCGRPAGAVSGAMPGVIASAGISGIGRGGSGAGSGRAWKIGPGWGRPPAPHQNSKNTDKPFSLTQRTTQARCNGMHDLGTTSDQVYTLQKVSTFLPWNLVSSSGIFTWCSHGRLYRW